MHIKIILKIIGLLLLFLSLSMLLPLATALYYNENPFIFLKTIFFGLFTGCFLLLISKVKNEIIGIKDGFIIVTLGWLFAGILGSIPFLLHDTFGPFSLSSFVDSFFESISGFTTTGASVINDIEALPKSLLLWRSLTHWLGGMGIILLSIAILPLLGVGGMQLFKAEVPGPVAEKIKPRISETAIILWYVYVLISALQVILLMLGNMSLFEALCHTFGTMATGGFSTKNASVAAYKSPYIQWVIIVFMIIAGTNFSLHYAALKGNLKSYFKNTESKVYFSTLFLLILICSLIYHFSESSDSIEKSFRVVAFQISSILTTTGYVTENYENWPYVLQGIIFLLMFIGGCAGSTGGSVKFMRYIVMFKHTSLEILKQIHPKIVVSLKFNKNHLNDNVVKAVWGFFFTFILIYIISSIIMCALGMDIISSFSSTIACLGNIGPGFGLVGPVSNYSSVPMAGKLMLSFLMLVGRLEVFTVIIIFVPAFWKN